jgi:hypothetical protein
LQGDSALSTRSFAATGSAKKPRACSKTSARRAAGTPCPVQ